MKISVITVSYNAASCIEDTIKSVICQRYNNFEYIIVDGASSDGTVDLIRKYNDKITRWISEPDKGIYNAMNKAVKLSTGDYCIFMNAGDMFANPLVLKQVSFFLEDDFDVLTGCEISTINGKPLEYVEPVQEVTKEHFFVTSISHQSSFIKRSLLLKYPYDESLRLVSDWKFWLQTIVFGGCSYRAIDVDVSLFNHDGLTFSSKMKETGRRERKQVIEELYSKEDIEQLSKKYNGKFFRYKKRLKAKLNRILNHKKVEKKIETFRSYISVLGLTGLIVGICHYISKGGHLNNML